MTTKAFYHAREIEVDLADLPRDMYEEISSRHGQIDRRSPILTCLGNLEPMYVWRHETGRYFVKHFPNGNPDNHKHRHLSTISDEHLRQAEYSQRAAASYGYDARLEVSTGNKTRLDVAVFSELGNIGFEIQRSNLTIPQAKLRTTRSFEAGFPTAWVTDRENDPAWADRVPTARLTTRGGWDEGLPKPNTAYVSISTFTRVRDKSRKTGWGYVRKPKAVLLDELAHLMPSRQIIPLSIGTQGIVVLAEENSAEIIDSCTYPGASRWNPRQSTEKSVKETVHTKSRSCHHSSEEVSEFAWRPRFQVQPKFVIPIRNDFPALRPLMQMPNNVINKRDPVGALCGCGGELLAPNSILRGFCEHCRMKGQV